jgi:F-type H+-transporting ATPase subunit delta
MADTLTIARPYAEAAFEHAKAQNMLAQWSDLLAALAAIAQDENAHKILKNPEVRDADKVKLFAEVLGEQLPENGKKLLEVMAEHDRLLLLPEVASIYESMRAAAENRVVAQAVSAMEPTVEQKQTLEAALKAKFNADVEVNYSINPDLIAGMRVQIGDWVVDGSARTQLNKLRAAIAQ